MKTARCEVCNQSFEVKPYRVGIAKYCSIACRNTAMLGKSPANKGKVTNQVSLTCENCGKEFTRIASRLKYGRGKHCSPECQYAAIKEREKLAQIPFNCLCCGKSFTIPKSRLSHHIGVGKYCSRACRDTHRSGENHPQYINGTAQHKYGPNWQSQKRKAKRRDNWTCQDCGMSTTESLKEFGQVLHVHHKIPFRLFTSYLEANLLPNLTTLCCRCHRIAETKYHQSE